MKRLPFLAVVSCLSFLMVSCASMYSTRYEEAGIRVVTDSRAVAGMRLVDMWKVCEPYLNARAVGILQANRLAETGGHDVSVLVEPYNAEDLIWQSMFWRQGMWQISVYRQGEEP
jgi:hypothetical protein